MNSQKSCFFLCNQHSVLLILLYKERQGKWGGSHGKLGVGRVSLSSEGGGCTALIKCQEFQTQSRK